MSQVLGALSLLGLGIFGPGIASGLVSGAPQLGAGAALGATGAAAGAVILGGGAAVAGARLAAGGGMAAIRAGTAMGSAASSAHGLGRATSGMSGIGGVASGVGGVARGVGGAAAERASSSLKQQVDRGRKAAWTATGGKPTAAMAEEATPGTSSSSGSAPDWARRLRAEQRARAHGHAVTQAVKDGDRSGGGATPSLQDKDE
jgi:type IV secretion system protein TrbL